MIQPYRIRVLCVDDHLSITEGLQACLNNAPGIEFVGSLQSADALVEEASRTDADVVVIDISMPGLNPFEAVSELHRVRPKVKVVFLSAHVLDRYIDAAFDAGASAYLSKLEEPNRIVDAIRKVHAGGIAMGSGIQMRLADHVGEIERRQKTHPVSRLQSLTRRQREVLGLIGAGFGRLQLAHRFECSPKTIDAHRAAIMEKIGLHDRAELALYAVREGLTKTQERVAG